MRPFLVALVALALVAVACSGDDDEGLPVLITRTPSPTAAATETGTATATSTETPSPTATPALSSTPTGTATPAATPPAAATPTSPPGGGGEPATEGVPFSRADLQGAIAPLNLVENGAVDPGCEGASVRPTTFAAAANGSDARFAIWVLWVYPDEDALAADWSAVPGQRPEPLVEGCEPPTAWIYWNSNLVLALGGFFGTGIESGSPPLDPSEVREHPVVQAFLDLTP